MFEVEAKVRVTAKEYQHLADHLKKIAGKGHESEKSDTYYADSKKVHIRSRAVDGKTLFTIKQKAIRSSVEANVEMEWEIKEPTKWNRLLSKIGFKPFIRKTKKSLTFSYKSFSVELNHIRELGYFLEIEKVVKNRKQVAEAKKELIALFKVLGYNQNQFERRYYLDLLEQVRK